MTKLENDRENEEYLNYDGTPKKKLPRYTNTSVEIMFGFQSQDFDRDPLNLQGEHSKHRLIRKRYERQVWVVLALIVAVTLILSR